MRPTFQMPTFTQPRPFFDFSSFKPFFDLKPSDMFPSFPNFGFDANFPTAGTSLWFRRCERLDTRFRKMH